MLVNEALKGTGGIRELGGGEVTYICRRCGCTNTRTKYTQRELQQYKRAHFFREILSRMVRGNPITVSILRCIAPNWKPILLPFLPVS